MQFEANKKHCQGNMPWLLKKNYSCQTQGMRKEPPHGHQNLEIVHNKNIQYISPIFVEFLFTNKSKIRNLELAFLRLTD